jgi:D-apionolactonase
MIRDIQLNGKGEAMAVPHILRSGVISMLYEGGNLRYIRAGGHEIIRMIYFAVRDKDWLTISPVISEEKIEKKRNGFEIGYKAHYRYKDIDFEAFISIVSSPGNRLIVEMKGQANSTFLKNRIGFCVLHPIMNLAGHECRITHPDHSSTIGRFPEDISPNQPFKDIRAMHWKINNSLEARLHLEGDIFETEDQRNWTDASYKTYSTPLDLPYPVKVMKGTSVFQRIEFSLEGECAETKKKDEKIFFRVGRQRAGRLPDIGVGVSSRPEPLTGHEASILKNIHFSHVRGELHLFGGRLEKQYAVLSGEAIQVGLPAEICLFFGNDPRDELEKFLILYHQNPVPVRRIIVLSGNAKVTSNDLLSVVIPHIRKEFPGMPTGTGTNCNFAQLNRSRPEFRDTDFVAFAIHPQEHAADERTLIENTAAQQYAVQSAAKFEMHKPVVVSPVTIQRRFNANRDNYEVPGDDNEMPPGVDPRQMSLFAAAWTVGSLKYLLESEVTSITYYETVGERGLFMGEHSSRWPGQFSADKDMIFPLFHIFRMLLNTGKFRVHGSYSSNPLVIDGFTVASENSGLLFLSNMTRKKQKVMLTGIDEYPNSGEHSLKPYETMILEYGL